MSNQARATLDVGECQARLRDFASARDWDQFHNPKNLSAALVVEASELLELFQWLTDAQAEDVRNDETRMTRIRHEIADVLIYVLRLADRLDIDLQSAVQEKLDINARKYPVEQSKGSARKYNELR